MRRNLLGLLGGVLLGFAQQLFAQQPLAPPPGGASATAPADTAARDSQANRPRIRPYAAPLNLMEAYRGTWHLDSLRDDLDAVHRWDPKDTLPGFGLALGQVGKPYARFVDGLPAASLASTLYRDPVSQRTDVYVLNAPTQAHTYDTRTPFIDVWFAQSAQETQLLHLAAAQNISPLFNTSLQYTRRTAQGVYNKSINNNLTDHFRIGWANHVRSLDGRYLGILSLAHNRLEDRFFGGSIQTGNIPRDELFLKESQRVEFDAGNVSYQRKIQSLHTYHHVFLVNDSAFKLGPFIRWTGTRTLRTFTDANTYNSATFLTDFATPTDSLQLRPSVPYQRFVGDTSSIREHYRADDFTAQTGVQAHLQLGPVRFRGRFTFAVERTAVTSDSAVLNVAQTRTRYGGWADLRVRLPKFDLTGSADVNLVQNNLFAPQFTADADLRFGFFARDFLLRDSSLIDSSERRLRLRRIRPFVYKGRYAPLTLDVDFRLGRLNPSLQDAFWNGKTFAGNPGLENQGVLHLAAELAYQGKPGIRRGLPFWPNRYGLRLVWARRDRPIYYTEEFTVQQAPTGEGVQYFTAGAFVQQRFWRIYFRAAADARLDARSANGPRELENFLPRVTGNSSLFYRQVLFKGAATVHIGVEAFVFSGYTGYRFDPALQAFYPQSHTPIQPYGRLDLVIAGQVRRAMVYAKFIHLNERSGANLGYWTVPFYPMLERSFSFGFRWRFYD